jgi:hypothetical protein
VSATAVSVAVLFCRLGTDEGAEGALQQVRQPPLHTVIGVFSLQDLELRLELASGTPLRRTKQPNQFRGKGEVVSIEWQPLGHDFLTVIALDQ